MPIESELHLVKPTGRGTRPKRGKYKMQRHEVYQGVFKIDGKPCRLIPLTHDKTAIVEAADFDNLNQVSWAAKQDHYTGNWYAIRTVHDGERHWLESMHRRLLGLQFGDPRRGDHVEVDQTLDNRRDNLRIASHGQNRMNSHLQRNNTTGCKGVSRRSRGGGYTVRIGFQGRVINLGDSKTLEGAVALRRAGEEKYHKEFTKIA